MVQKYKAIANNSFAKVGEIVEAVQYQQGQVEDVIETRPFDPNGSYIMINSIPTPITLGQWIVYQSGVIKGIVMNDFFLRQFTAISLMEIK